MADKDFVIKNSTLVEYIGTDSIVIIPDGITCIGEYAFSDNEDITHVTIPVGVTTIEEYAFSDCTNLEAIIFPDSIRIVEEGAFQSCVSLKSIVIPEGVVSIGASIRVDEGISWDTLKTNISSVVPLYDVGGAKELIGAKSNKTYINALKRFAEFVGKT